MNETLSQSAVPHWNLDSIFPSLGSDKYKKAVDDYKKGISTLSNMLKNSEANFLQWLSEYLTEQNKVLSLAQTLNSYAYIIYSVETTNTKLLNNIAKIEEISIEYEQTELAFQNVLRNNAEKLNQFYKDHPKFSEYKYLLEHKIEKTTHQMTPSEEKLALDMQHTGGDAWDRLHEQIISNLKNQDGKSFNALRNDAYSQDAALRKKSYEEEISLLKQNEIAFASCLNNLKGETLTLNKRRNWNSAIERSLFESRLSKESLLALISSIEETLPKWREYFKLKAKYLKKNALTVSKSTRDGIAFYDLFAPLETQCENSEDWTFSKARDYIISQYSSFSKEMGDFAKNAFDSNWIDAEIRQGKVGGAYDEDFALNHESRILTNFSGTFSDVITLAHELGHAYHFSCLKGKPVAFFSYPMTLAETASTFAETIVKQDMLSKAESSKKLLLLDMDLQDVSQVLVDILCRFYFEKSVFEERSQTELNSDDFCRLMRDAQEKSYGDGLSEERHEYMWAVKSHYYSTSLDFYNFPYAFGQLFAASLYMNYKNEGEGFSKKYSRILSMTGSMACEELCRLSGFDITKKDFWLSGMKMYLDEIKEFKKLV